MEKLLFVLVCFVLGAASELPDKSDSSPKPHIIIFLVDDLGWNDVGFHGMTEIPTPNIDALAADGIILNNYYTAPACTPTRASLMTGYYPSSTGNQHRVIRVAQASALPLSFRTLPQALNTLGYESHMIGKWHLGFFKQEYTPTLRGFRSHYGFWFGAVDMFFHEAVTGILKAKDVLNVPEYETRDTFELQGLDFRNGTIPVTNRNGEYLTDIYTEEAVRRIEGYSSDKPLFLYLSHHGVHRGNMVMPIRAPKKYTKGFDYIGDDARRNFAGSLKAIDDSLGQVVSALEKSGMLNNTIVIFSTDNGAPKRGTFTDNGGSNYPLRGNKFSVFEGGSRAASFVWSSLLPNRKRFEGLMHVADWMPTLYQAAGGNVRHLGDLDGLSMLAALQNKELSPRKDVLITSDPFWNLTSYRYGNYKIVLGQDPVFESDGRTGDVGREVPPPASASKSMVADVLERFYKRPLRIPPPFVVDCGEGTNDTNHGCDVSKEMCLFDLNEDPCEYRNLAQERPEILKELQEKYQLLKKKVVRPWYPAVDYRSNPVFHGGFWSSWMDNPI